LGSADLLVEIAWVGGVLAFLGFMQQDRAPFFNACMLDISSRLTGARPAMKP
jgi:hypothetical protein